MQHTVLLSLVRRSEGLFAWISDPPDGEHDAPARCIALAALPAALYPGRDALLADWDSLQNATAPEPVWPAFWRVFWRTLTELREQSPVAIPKRIAPPAPPVATAAHPRAYRGTKFVPPKAPVRVLDLCAWLSEDRLVDSFLAQHEGGRLPRLDASGQPATGPSITAPERQRALPDPFRRLFCWQLRGRPPQELTAWLQIWRGLGSASDGPALTLPARLCALSPGAHAWSGMALSLAPERQLIFLNTVLAERAYTLPADRLLSSQLAELSAMAADDASFGVYLRAVLANLQRQVSAAYTLLGCSLANRRSGWDRLDGIDSKLATDQDCHDVPMDAIDRMGRAIGSTGRWELEAWHHCASTPGFAAVLRATHWESLSDNVACQWIALFWETEWDQPPAVTAQRARARHAAFPEWHRQLTKLAGPWQEKFVCILRDHACQWNDVAAFTRSIPHLLPLQLRLCRPPYTAGADGTAVLSPMARYLRVEDWQQLAALDDRHWLIAEQACRRDNDGMLISRGLYSLSQNWPAFVIKAFVAAPRRLMRSARLLGCLSYERRRQFLAQTAHAAWFATDWRQLAPLAACRALYQQCRTAGIDSPLPRRLRDHLENGLPLSERQIERHCRVALARLPAVLLEALERHVWDCIDARFNLRTHSTAASHAVRMLAGLDARDNRSGMRRFLINYSQGQGGAYLDHPRNRAWFARHPRIIPALWSPTEPAWRQDGQGEVQIAIETDPLEVLMLGTYVGSCLGLGGLCNYSAVACLLDANKQVLYARDARGRVLARQLIAIDESERLVCFDVYPVTAGDTLRAAFKAHNAALASALGIALYRDQTDDYYKIPTILAQFWWDDGIRSDDA